MDERQELLKQLGAVDFSHDVPDAVLSITPRRDEAIVVTEHRIYLARMHRDGLIILSVLLT